MVRSRPAAAAAALLAAALVLAPAAPAATAPPPAATRSSVPPGTGPSGTAPSATEAEGEVPSWLAAPGPTPRDDAVRACLVEEGRPLDLVTEDHTRPWPGGLDHQLDHRTVVDARGRVFDDTDLNEGDFGTGVKFHESDDSRDDLCFVGGSIISSFDAEQTPWDTWHRVTAMTVLTPGAQVIGTRLFNQGDGIAFGSAAEDWKVIGVRVDGAGFFPGGYVHDDCVENDGMVSGVIDDAKLDGCHVFLSSIDEGTVADPGARVEVRRTLVRLQPFASSFNTEKYGTNQHGGFFKWSHSPRLGGVPPALTVEDAMFYAEGPAPYGGNANGGLGLPDGTTCRNVVLIGTETWPARDLASWQDQCRDLTLGTPADWAAATAAWDEAHPPLRSLRGQGVVAVDDLIIW
jgi:hypothetical protein